MRPILFTWRGRRVYSYPAMLYVGIVLGIVAGDYVSNLAGLNSARVYVALLGLTLTTIVGARLLHVLTHPQSYGSDFRSVWRTSQGGASMQGGFLLSLVVAVPLLALLRIPMDEFADVAIFALLVTMMFGRIGCALHGCCGGRPSTGFCALRMRDYRGIVRRRIPTQFLEAGLAALILVAAAGMWSRRPFDGSLFLGSLIAYNAARLFLQPLRDTQDRFGQFNVQQAVAATIAVLGMTVFLGVWRTSLW